MVGFRAFTAALVLGLVVSGHSSEKHAAIAGIAPRTSGIAFADLRKGVAMVDGDIDPGIGQLQVTTDGGRTWRTIVREAHLSLVSIAFVGRRHIVVLGGAPPPKEPWNLDPLIFRSDDAGRTWKRFTPKMPNWNWPLTLQFVTPSLGFAVAPAGDFSARIWLIRTTDGGRTWRPVPRPADAGNAASSVDFVNARTGFATSSRRCGAGLYRTRDGGATWRAVPGSCIHGVHAYSADFSDSAHGVLAGSSSSKSLVFATIDGGRTWAPRSRTPLRVNAGSWIHVEFFRSGRVGWGVRGDCSPYHPPCDPQSLWRTTDGGATWRNQGLRYLADFDALDGRRAWTVAPTGSVWKTANGGRSWSRLPTRR